LTSTNGATPISNTNRHSNKHATTTAKGNLKMQKKKPTMISPGRRLPVAFLIPTFTRTNTHNSNNKEQPKKAITP
jgi:hypothetical protein